MTMSPHVPNRAVYVISVAAELAGVHPQTLRIYERKGLLEPSRTAGGSRRYSDADIARLHRIAELASEGMNLSGIRRVMELELENDRLRRENDELRLLASQSLAEAERRQPRRDIVPLRQSVAVFGKLPSIFER
jgi:MerR family transcriptional regulator/heat shock protein HspR